MGTEVELDAGMAKFKVDLSEFTSAIRSLAEAAIGASEKEQARSAIKDMIAEVRKTFDTIVDTLTPLYKLTDESQFSARFADNHASFKALYLNRSDLVRTHCHIVRQHFDALQQRRDWMASLPLAGRAYAKLERICSEWLLYDLTIVHQMESFFQTLNRFMDEIKDLSRREPAQGFQALASGLKLIEGSFLDIKRQLGELDALGRRL